MIQGLQDVYLGRECSVYFGIVSPSFPSIGELGVVAAELA